VTHHRHLGSTPGYWPAQEAQGDRRQGVRGKEELKQARESCDLMKEQVEVCKSETEKEPLRWELVTLETQIKACKADVASAKSNQIATMALIFSMATATIFYPEMLKLCGTK